MVYFVQGEDGGPIKIGYADNVAKRMIDLQIGSPIKLKLLGVINGGMKREKQIHGMFLDERQHGEWFSPSARLTAFLKVKCAVAPVSQGILPTSAYVGEVEAASIMGINHRTLANWRSLCKGPNYYKISSRLIRYKISDIVNFMSNKEILLNR